MKFLGTRFGLRQRPEGCTRMSEAEGADEPVARVYECEARIQAICAGERMWLKTGRNFIQDAKGMCKKNHYAHSKRS